MKEDTTIIELAHRVVEKLADRQARIGYISAEELDYAVLAQEVISINQQLTEKDAIMKELEREFGYAKRQATYWNEKAVALKEENTRLRKVLEEAKYSIQRIDSYGESPYLVTNACEDALKEIDAALGEGDKE